MIARRLEGRLDSQNQLLPPPSQAVKAYGITALLNGALILSFYFIAQAVGVKIGVVPFIVAYPLAQLSLIASITPGGLGIFDLGWLGLLVLSGVPEEQALTFVVAQRAYVSVFVLVWTGFSIMLAFTDTIPASITNDVEPPQE